MDWKEKTICEQLIEFANTIKDEINRNNHASLTFVVQDRKVIRFEKKLSIKNDDTENDIRCKEKIEVNRKNK